MAALMSRSVVTPDDYSSIPGIISLLIGVIVILSVGVRAMIKCVSRSEARADDAALLLSVVFSVGMVGSTMAAVSNGLGRYSDSLTEGELRRFQQSIYATEVLYTITLLLSKGSMLITLSHLTPAKGHWTLVWATATILGLWTTSAFFTTIFQCPAPGVWTILSDRCINRKAFWLAYDGFNIVTEVCLGVIPFVVIKALQIRLRAKIVIMMIFLLRLIVIAPIIGEIVARTSAAHSGNDQTFELWPVILSMQIVQCLSIVFACVPFLKPFFSAFEAGMVRVNDTNTAPFSNMSSTRRSRQALGSMQSEDKIQITAPSEEGEELREFPDVSTPDRPRSHEIMATTTVEVRHEERHGSISNKPKWARS